jgi:hypothetical protein
MECPYCDHELKYHDHYGKNLRLDSLDRIKPGYEKQGNIYKCMNEECEMYDEHFYTDKQNNLHEGHPC